MKIFEELIEELKRENLLETTVVNRSPLSSKGFSDGKLQTGAPTANPEQTSPEKTSPNAAAAPNHSGGVRTNSQNETQSLRQTSASSRLFEKKSPNKNQTDDDLISDGEITEIQFFKQRAIDEVSGLQMVEHVISGIEREQMKSVSGSYNDLQVKQALHNFLKINDPETSEHAAAEFQLMQETENWYSSLSRRDRKIAVAQFRRFCELTKPPLSSRALMALGRFYRNSPFAEPVRGKFDLVVTRLFTQEADSGKREILFKKEEIARHVQELYKDWASVPLYPTDENDSGILLCVLQFQDFVDEVSSVEKFDDLIRSELFTRIKAFKEKTSENFFCPQVVAAAVECNVAVGNKYIDLIEKEKNSNRLCEKYGMMHDETISEATGKTLELIELLREKDPARRRDSENPKEKPAKNSAQTDDAVTAQNTEKSPESANEIQPASENSQTAETPSNEKARGTNKILIGALVLILCAAGVFHFLSWLGVNAENSSDAPLAPGVEEVKIDGSSLSRHLLRARISKETFFAIAKPSWNKLGGIEKENYLKKIRSIGSEYEFRKILIIDEKGAIIASATEEKINSGS